MTLRAEVVPRSVASAVGPDRSVRASELVLIPLKDDGTPDVSTFGAPLRFQYFPEEITDTKSTNYQQKEIPGGTLPIYQWIASGARQLQFMVKFTSDVDAVADANARRQVFSNTSGLRDRNVDIRAAVAWLRSFMLARYLDGAAGSGGGGASSTGGVAPGGFSGASGSSGITVQTRPPRKVRLFAPNSGLGIAGGVQAARGQQAFLDSVTCVMTQCDVTWSAYFPSGYPRIASVQLSFEQIAQLGSRVVFPSADGVQSLVSGDPGTGGRSFFGYRLSHRQGTSVEAFESSGTGQVADQLGLGLATGVSRL